MIEKSEEISVQRKYQELLNNCRNFSDEDTRAINDTFAYISNFFGNKRRESGELEICHSLSVAMVVAREIGLGAPSVAAALLHNIIESPDQSLTEVERKFGKEIATIVRGFKKLSLIHSEKVSLHSENFRKLFLSYVDDIRIIFIKMAHRLYDMRTFEKIPEKLKTVFLEDVQYIYIPIAHRLGLYQIKAELEDLSMKWSKTEEYNKIASKLRETKRQQNRYIKKFIQPLKKKLVEANVNFEIESRAKSVPSIRKKMNRQKISLDQVFDLFAIRVILKEVLTKEDEQFLIDFKTKLETEGDPTKRKKIKKVDRKKPEVELREESEKKLIQQIKIFKEEKKRQLDLLKKEKSACWFIYSVITDIYQPNPKRLRDWITSPKFSGYEALHTTVIGTENRCVEVQIRTQRMDDIAEKGDAAHWKYKESAYGKDVALWTLEIRNILEMIGSETLGDTRVSKIESPTENIYVFTPKGDLKELQAGSTILDFAFDIHTGLGAKCTGGKISGKVFPIRHVLQNGDKVEILTSKNQKPNPDWLNFVVTSKAKVRIKRSIREEKYKEAQAGKDILIRKFRHWKIDFSDQNLTKVVKYYNYQKPLDLYYNIAKGKLDVLEIKQFFAEAKDMAGKEVAEPETFEITEKQIEEQSVKDKGHIVLESGMSNLNYSLAKCCNPIAGDPIFGFITINKGIIIHRKNCSNAKYLKKNYPYRKIEARWKETKSTDFFVTNLKILGLDRMGILNNITNIISNDLKINMLGIDFKPRNEGFECLIKVHVRNAEHLGFLKKKLLNIKGVTKVIRYD